MLRVFCKNKGMLVSESPIPKSLAISFNSFSHWPWTQLIKIAVDEVQFDGLRPTRQNVMTENVSLRATLRFCLIGLSGAASG